MANSGKFRKGASASKANMKKQQKGTKPPFPGAKSKAQGGTPHRMSKPEGSKANARSGLKKGRATATKGPLYGPK